MRDVGQRNHDVAQLGAGAGVDVRGVDLGFVILRGQPWCEQSQRRKRGHRAETDRASNTIVVNAFIAILSISMCSP